MGKLGKLYVSQKNESSNITEEMIKRDKTQDITHNLNQDTQYSSMHVNGRCVLMTRCSSIPGKESWKEIHCPSFHAHPSTSLSSDKNTRDRTATRERNKLLVTI